MNKFEQLYEAAIAEAKRNREANKAPGSWNVGDPVVLQSRVLASLGLGEYNNRPGVITEVTSRSGRVKYTVIVEERPGSPVKYKEMSLEEHEFKRPSESSKASSSNDYATITDRKGVQLHPGDRVRIKRYPRGTVEGVVVVSPRTLVVLPDGSTKRALSVKDEVDGTIYELKSKGALKL
jgi:hypothetical protein